MWVRSASPQNQAETTAPLAPDEADRVLAVSLEPAYAPEMRADFARTGEEEVVNVRLDSERSRRAELFIAQGYVRRPRDPVTGLPTPP
jgi:hypothetical protein